jgi:hypothetical protein
MPDLESPDDDLRRRTRAYLAQMQRQAPPADLEERIGRAVFPPRRGKRLAAAGGTFAVVVVCAVIAVVALAVHGGGRSGGGAASTSTGNQSLTVTNVNGPEVAVEFWPGGPVEVVAPGETEALATYGAPPQPWQVTVTAVASHQVLLHQSPSASQEIVVSSSGVTVQTAAVLPTPTIPGDGLVTGTLEAVGGPAPGSPRPLSGTVTLRNTGGSTFAAQTSSDGTFSIEVPAGSYAITGRSPLFQSGAVDCQASGPLTVTAGGTSSVAIDCQES